MEFNSHGIWGQGNQLENGIAANGMSGKENLTKIEFINQNVYHVRSTYVEVDGYPSFLELVVQSPEETHMDHFEALNDTYGHPVGDLALKQAAKAIKNCVKRTDSVVRFGGDEIFVVFGDIPFHMLQEKLEEIRSLSLIHI